MRFTSELYSYVDKNKVWIFNFRAIRFKMD